MLVDPVKHYFYIWLIRVRLSHIYGDTAAALAKNITEQERESRSAMRMKCT